MANNHVYLRTVETLIEGSGVDGDFEFDLDPAAALNNIVAYFYFVDSGGDQVDATGGTVVITMSSGADIYGDISNGFFDAIDARSPLRTKPNGFGKSVKVKFTLDGITGDPTEFRAFVTQSVS